MSRVWHLLLLASALWHNLSPLFAQHTNGVSQAVIDGTGPGWQPLGKEDFVNVNCAAETWRWTNGIIVCSGKPVGVMRTVTLCTNFELVVQWRHLQSGGNSGVFVWATPESIAALEQGQGRLPTGIEVLVRDLGYT